MDLKLQLKSGLKNMLCNITQVGDGVRSGEMGSSGETENGDRQRFPLTEYKIA